MPRTPEINLTDWGGTSSVLGKAVRVSYRGDKSRLSIHGLGSDEAKRLLVALALGGPVRQGAPTPHPTHDPRDYAAGVDPRQKIKIEPSVSVPADKAPEQQAEDLGPTAPLTPAQEAAEESAAAPPTQEEMQNEDDPAPAAKRLDEKPPAPEPAPEPAAKVEASPPEPKAEEPPKPRRRRSARRAKKAEEPEPPKEQADVKPETAPKEEDPWQLSPQGEPPKESPRPAGNRDEKGYIRGCALAAGKPEAECPVCKGRCQDRRMFAETGHGHLLSDAKPAGEQADPEPSKPKGNGEVSEARYDLVLLKKKETLRDILSHLARVGYDSPEAILDVCKELKDEVPVLTRIPSIETRVPRALEVMGIFANA